MEDTLRGKINSQVLMSLTSLNPCFNGRYSQSKDQVVVRNEGPVLILVLMEDTLREGFCT